MEVQALSVSIPLHLVKQNPENPRTVFDPIKLEELSTSIKEHGVIEPIIVEAAPDGYMLHAGERRTMAARMAGLLQIPAVIVPAGEYTPQQRLERALVENVQRENMNPIEEGKAYRRLRDEFGLTLTEISKRTGRNKTIIGHRLLLIELEPEIQGFIQTGDLPHDSDAVKAMLTLPAGETRIKICARLARSKPSIKVVVSTCARMLEALQKETVSAGAELKSPAVEIATKQYAIKLPEWDALQQLGALPQWSAVREAATATCDACALRPVASEKNCRDCPLVDCLRKVIATSHQGKKYVKRK